MNIQLITNLVDNLIDTQVQTGEDRRNVLRSYYLRILTSNFGEEFEQNSSLEVRVAKSAGRNKDRALDLLAAFRNKRSLERKDGVIKTLLKISENSNNSKVDGSVFLGNFSTQNTTAFDTTTTSHFYTNPRQISAFGKNKSAFGKNELSQGLEIESTTFQRMFKSLISTFQAVHSEFFFYDKRLEMFVLKQTGEGQVSLSFMRLTQKLNEMGWLFQKIASAFDSAQKKIITLTMQGLICALKNELNRFYGFVVQLEKMSKNPANFSNYHFVSTLFILCEEQFKKLRVFAYIIEISATLTSAEVLSLLFLLGRDCKNNSKQEYLGQIFEATGRTFIEFINAWINRGEILDPMGEFFIRANLSCTESDKYWKDGLQFLEDKVPNFMDRGTARSIFTVGKIVRLLKKVNSFTSERLNRLVLDEIVFYNNDLSVFNKLNGIHIVHNRLLIDQLFGQQKLKSVLSAYKALFLGSRGDFIGTFIENLDNEISLKNLPKAMKHQIYFCLEAAFKLSFRSHNLRLKNLNVAFIDRADEAPSLTTEDTLNYFVNFSFSVDSLDVPLNNVITSESLKVYQQILRYLLTFKIEQYELRRIWNLHSKQKIERNVHMQGLIALSSNIRIKMLSFVEALLNYWSIEVIERQWKILMDELDAVTEFEAVIHAHESFLQAVVGEIHMQKKKTQTKTAKGAVDAGKNQERPKSRYDLLLHQILELIYRFKNAQEIIFVSLKPNLDLVDGDSYDSIERIENHNVERLIDLNENFVRQMHAMLREIELRMSKCVIDLLDFYDNKNITNRFDFNEYYQTERKISDQRSAHLHSVHY